MTKVIAHRGASGDFPENSLEAILAARSQGADAVEVDIRCTSDNVPIICHDRRLRRLFNSNGTTASITAAQFKKMRIMGTGTPLLLEELFNTDDPPREIILDIKEFGLEIPVEKMICRNGWQERVIVSSFYSIIIKRFKRLNAELRTALILDRLASIPIALRQSYLNHIFLKYLEADYLHVFFREMNLAGARKIAELGHPVSFWTLDDPATIERALTISPYGIITNKPGIARGIIQSEHTAQS
ncbi:MAG: glycerophosphodiester phosphodiesterase [Candidatus Zixiibacteriota bacterium]